MRVTLLGTGCPIADEHRYGPSALVEAGEESWLVDCGSGVTQRLLAHGSSGARITGLLLTHLHSDHTVDFIQLLISGWHQGRQGPLRVYGPARTKAFFEGLLEAWQPEFRQRLAHELRPPQGLEVEIEEIDGNWTLQTPELRIGNTEVRHQPIPQSFGFRFDNEDGSAVISGDTAYCPELIELALDTDLLVHEAYVHWAQQERNRISGRDPQGSENVRAYHTTTEEVGLVARNAGAKNLVLTHFVPTIFDRERVVADVRKNYSGGLFVGEDLMCWEIRGSVTSLLRSGVRGHP
ncbi:MAG: MBL fold metallo-hydrolase [SAR324 cluster bacterium]|nr:MBL fold metallo-hydrolase [SAR324 cluster bacterium]